MLHVWIFPIWLEGAHAKRCYRSRCGYCYAGWDRLIQTRRSGDRSDSAGNYTNIECLLKWRIRTDVLLVCPIQHLIVIDAVAGANGSRTFAERIPGDAKARPKITF